MNKNLSLFEQSQTLIPGGVNSPVRAFGSVGGTPIFFKKGLGSRLWDENDKEYIDYINSWGPMILGHANPEVLDAVKQASQNSLSFGAPTSRELAIAEEIIKLVPSIEQVRLVSSGTEATMSAIRVARGYTGRDKIVKFEGCYHGHADALLVKAGSGALTLGLPDSPGVTKNTARDTLIATYNDKNSVEKVLKENIDNVAAIIVEPIAGNMGLVTPDNRFLKGLRELSLEYECLLIFDEVMTGFRLARGGAQELLGIKADIATYGKVIGGGLPVGAFAAKNEIMKHPSPI